jgi:hypothetical protein
MKEEKNNITLDLSKISNENNSSTNNQPQNNNNDSNESNINPIDLSSSEHNTSQFLRNTESNSNNYFRKSLSKSLSFLQSYFDEEKHVYKYYNEQIISNQDITDEIKSLYLTFYEDIEEKLNEIRTTKKNKEAFKEKFAPNYWGEQDPDSKRFYDTTSQEIEDLIRNKEKLKNSLVLLQSIILKNIDKAKAILNSNSKNLLKLLNNFIDVANKNSDSYEILKLLKETKYAEIINNVEKYKSLDNSIKLQFLEYLASDQNINVANNLFSQNFNLRIDVFNHYIDNGFWIGIYSSGDWQRYAENFYESYGRGNHNLLPKIPFWGIIILSRNQGLSNDEIAIIINDFLQSNLPVIINDLGVFIDSYQNDTQNEVPENQYNLISNLSNYLTTAEIAIPNSEDQKAASLVKKIIDFQSSYNTNNNSLYGITENLSTIHQSSNKAYISDNSYEYYSHKGTLNNPLLQYDVLYKYSNNTKKLTIKNCEYIDLGKKPGKEKIEEKKLDDKKNLNSDGNNETKENPTTAFIKGGVTVLTTEFIFFILWSAYSYWHQRSVIIKLTEKANKDLNELLHKDLPVLTLESKKVKNIFDNTYDENNKKSEDEDDFDSIGKLIIDTPIYDNKIKSYIIDTPKIPKEIIATPFKGIYTFIIPNNEYHIIGSSECDNSETNNYNIDLVEL